jgi:hypothetical protein
MEYAWYHSQKRPLGISLPLQCRRCGRLHSLSLKYHAHLVEVTCTPSKGCGRTVQTSPRDVWKYNTDKRMSESSGWGWRCHWQREEES